MMLQLQFNERVALSSCNRPALQSRSDFLSEFPIARLRNLRLEDYVVGRNGTFCYMIEYGIRHWANTKGSPPIKFGIYLSKKGGYKYSDKFGKGLDYKRAFKNVRSRLIELVKLGEAENPNFHAIDDNPLSQMFKAKILSLYFPERFANICSKKHLILIADALGLPARLPTSEYQHLIVQVKSADNITRSWSNPKFMAFLYETIILPKSSQSVVIHKPDKKSHQKVNFEDIQLERNLVGKAAEEFALKWEKKRLRDAGMDEMVKAIRDRRDRPGFGYDFLSHTAPDHPRYIEGRLQELSATRSLN